MTVDVNIIVVTVGDKIFVVDVYATFVVYADNIVIAVIVKVAVSCSYSNSIDRTGTDDRSIAVRTAICRLIG